jgi:hypothetical protein
MMVYDVSLKTFELWPLSMMDIVQKFLMIQKANNLQSTILFQCITFPIKFQHKAMYSHENM